MKIKFKSDEEFQRLLEALAQELGSANDHWRLYNDLKSKVKNFAREYSQSPTFWWLTFRAHGDAVIFRLIRIFDTTRNSSLSLPNLLDTIEANLNIFDSDRFRERLKNNPFVESLADDVRKPDDAQLKKDIEFSGQRNPLVKKLTILRHKLFAHKDAKNVIMVNKFTDDHLLSDEEINELLEKGIKILNRYRLLFRAEMNSTQIVGHGDYELILKSIRVYLEERDKKIKVQIKALEALNPEK